MKDKIILFIIGVLVGAVIATGAFFVYNKSTNTCNNVNTQMNGGEPPEMPSGQNGQPPEMPNGQMPTTPSNSN